MHPSMASPSIPTLSAHGAEMPAIGFGTSSLGDCGEIVASALRVGYCHIDTAWKYGTERGVGEGIRASGVRRDEIFLTTKVSHEYLRADDFARSVDQSLKTLGVDFVDLLLVHWPNPEIPLSEPHSRARQGQTAGTCAPYRGCEFQYRHARRSDPALSGAAGQFAGRVSRSSRPNQAHGGVPPARSDLRCLLPARPRAAVG